VSVGVTFNDLRGTAVTRLALVGCTEAEIASITGHSLRDVRSILDAHYLTEIRSWRALLSSWKWATRRREPEQIRQNDRQNALDVLLKKEAKALWWARKDWNLGPAD
jgi:hypothetical protein